MEIHTSTEYELIKSYKDLVNEVGENAAMELMKDGQHFDADFNDGAESIYEYSLCPTVVEDEDGIIYRLLKLTKKTEVRVHWEE